jgi:hypothetical protein
MLIRFCLFAAFTLFWLIPFFLTGSLLGTPLRVYRRLEFQYSSAALFTRRIARWNQPVFQVQTGNAPDWKILNTSELSPMGAFGYRQRLDRILLDTNGKKTADEVRQRLAEWIANTHASKHPVLGAVTAVRMGSYSSPSNSPELAAPSGRWVPGLQPNSTLNVYATYMIREGKASPVRRDKDTNSVPSTSTPSVFRRKPASTKD